MNAVLPVTHSHQLLLVCVVIDVDILFYAVFVILISCIFALMKDVCIDCCLV